MRGRFSYACSDDLAQEAIVEFLHSEQARDIEPASTVIAFTGPRLRDIRAVWIPILGPVAAGVIEASGQEGQFSLRLRPLVWLTIVLVGLMPVALALSTLSLSREVAFALASWILVCSGWLTVIYLRFKHGLEWACRLSNKR